MASQPEVRVSDFFKLNKTQVELDFVDVPIDGDVQLFVDPYAFTLENDPWFVECNNLVIDYFALLIESIRAKREDQALRLLSNLHEPQDTHLGFSLPGSAGRGIGRYQAEDLLAALSHSKAVQTGSLDDLSDCELMIPGISGDKISDITTNIIRGKLLEYSESQCVLHGIPLLRVQGGVFWDGNRHGWVNSYANMPVINGRRLLLIPKACVRFRPEITAAEFYNHHVLNYLQAEHLKANDSLVHTLKSGARKVYKKELKVVYPESKEFIFEFSQKHPEVLKAYKNSVRDRSRPLRDQDLEMARSEYREVDFGKLVAELNAIPSGAKDASTYHNFIFGVLQAIFYPSLRYPQKEEEIHDGRKRIDITFNNGARDGFFEELRSNYEIFCPFIFFECKNYSSDPANPELDQIAGRFSDKRGKFGVIVCRTLDDKAKMQKRCKDALNDNRGFIMILDDKDIMFLLKCRSEQNTKQITAFMNDKMRNLLM